MCFLMEVHSAEDKQSSWWKGTILMKMPKKQLSNVTVHTDMMFVLVVSLQYYLKKHMRFENSPHCLPYSRFFSNSMIEIIYDLWETFH